MLLVLALMTVIKILKMYVGFSGMELVSAYHFNMIWIKSKCVV